jgi:hypothetical protein
MARRRNVWLGLAFIGVSLSAGCATPPEESESERRLASLEAEGREMDAALDTVETRLLGNQANLMLWQELGRRHQQVSAIACENANFHMEGMMRHLEHQEEKARKLKGRVAAVDTVLTSGKAPKRGRN